MDGATRFRVPGDQFSLAASAGTSARVAVETPVPLGLLEFTLTIDRISGAVRTGAAAHSSGGRTFGRRSVSREMGFMNG